MTQDQISKAAAMRKQYPELFAGMPESEPSPATDPSPIAESLAAVRVASVPVAAHGAVPIVDPSGTVTPLGEVGQAQESAPSVIVNDSGHYVEAPSVEAPSVEALSADQGPGFVVFWSVQGGQDRNAIESALASAPPSIASNFPGAPSPVAALQRAKTSTAGKVLGVVMRSIAKGSIALVSETTGNASAKAGQLDYSHGVTVSVPTGTATALRVDGYDETAQDCLSAANELALAYADHMTRVEAADLSAWLTACTDDLGAVSLRPRGGVYFIPASKGAELALLKKAASATGAAQLYTMALSGDKGTAKDVAGATAESFLGDFKTIEREVSNWTDGLTDSKRPGRGFNALSSQLKTLKDRVFMYREVLAAQENTLSAVIESANNTLRATFEKYTTTKQSLTVTEANKSQETD